MKDLLFIILAFALIGIQRGDEPVEYDSSAWVEPACTFLPGDWPETYSEICEVPE